MNEIELLPAQNYLRKAIREGKNEMIAGNLIKIVSALKEESNEKMKAILKMDIARALRVLGNLEQAAMLVKELSNNFPSGMMRELPSLQRLQIRIALDLGELGEAANIAEKLDGVEMNIGGGVTAATKVFRDERKITFESWLTLAEVSIFAGDYKKALTCLENADLKLKKFRQEASNESEAGDLGETEAETTEKITDAEATLEFYEIILLLISQAGPAFGELEKLSEKLLREPSPNVGLVSSLKCVKGEWTPESENPPAGLGKAEALRWYRVSEIKPATENEAHQHTDQDRGEKNDVSEKSENSSENQLNTTITLAELKKLMLLKNLAGAETSQDELYGGSFRDVVLSEMLENRQHKFTGGQKPTGYFEVKWSSRLIEPTVLIKKITPKTKAGLGYVFIKDGLVIDATLGDYDVPRLVDEKDDLRDALEAVAAMIQIGNNVGIEGDVSGSAYFFPSPAVALRRERLPKLNHKGIWEILAKREKELGLQNFDEEELDLDNIQF